MSGNLGDSVTQGFGFGCGCLLLLVGVPVGLLVILGSFGEITPSGLFAVAAMIGLFLAFRWASVKR